MDEDTKKTVAGIVFIVVFCVAFVVFFNAPRIRLSVLDEIQRGKGICPYP